MRLSWMGVLAPLVGLGLAGGIAEAQQAGMDEPAASAPAEALYSSEDLQFLHHMSIHHQQALAMCALVPERTDRETFIRFARYVERAQAAEIEAMHSLLKLAAKRGLPVPQHAPQGDPPMAGMLSKAEMAALEAAEGAEFERRWLDGMIFHHEGGLAMARAQQLQQLLSGRQPFALHVLVEDILIEQRAEITKMRGWLQDWGLVRGGEHADRRDPAPAVTSPTPEATVPLGEAATLIGTAIDDIDIAGVRVAVQNMATGQWWQGDGGWGAFALHPAEITRSGPGSMAWTYEWTPPAEGRYNITVQAEDTAGKIGTGREPRTFTVQ